MRLHDRCRRCGAENEKTLWSQGFLAGWAPHRNSRVIPYSENVRTHGLRRSRYRGLVKTHVQHVLTGMACNLNRLADWFAGTPKTRRRASSLPYLCATVVPAAAL